LDPNDRKVLDALADHIAPAILGQVSLKIWGHADYRGTAKYNKGLGLKRARAVKAYIDAKIRQSMGQPSGYKSVARSFGETYAGRHSLAGDRRVDIISSVVTARPPIRVGPFRITGTYDGPLSNKFKFRTLIGAGVGIGPVAGQSFSIEIMNSRTGNSAMYTYTGAGPGIGFSYNRPTGWDEKKIEPWIDVDDFEGSGKVTGVGAGKTGSVFTFNGPRDRGKTAEPVTITFEGWDLVLGFEADVTGHWHKR